MLMGARPRVALGQAHHAQRHAVAIDQFEKILVLRRVRCLARHAAYLGAAAANVIENNIIDVFIEQRPTANRGQFGFGLTVDNFHPQAGFFAHALNKLGTIAGASTRLGGDTTQAHDIGAANFTGRNSQSRQRALHRVFG